MKEKEEAEENKSKKIGKKARRNLIHIEEDRCDVLSPCTVI